MEHFLIYGSTVYRCLPLGPICVLRDSKTFLLPLRAVHLEHLKSFSLFNIGQPHDFTNETKTETAFMFANIIEMP